MDASRDLKNARGRGQIYNGAEKQPGATKTRAILAVQNVLCGFKNSGVEPNSALELNIARRNNHNN